MKLIETYNGDLTRVIIEPPDDYKSDIRCFPSMYVDCDGSCGVENAYTCENWQIKSRPGDKPWESAEIQSVIDVVSSKCRQAKPIAGLEGEYTRITMQRWQNHPNVVRLHDIEYINTKIQGALSSGGFNLNRYGDITEQVSDFYNKVIKRDKKIDISTDKLRSELDIPHEWWKGLVPNHVSNTERILIVNRAVTRDELGELPTIEGCEIGDIFSGELKILKQNMVRCRNASLVSLFDSESETIDFVESLCVHRHSAIRVVLSNDDAHLKLCSKAIQKSVKRPHDGIEDVFEKIKHDISYYQKTWRNVHARGL